MKYQYLISSFVFFLIFSIYLDSLSAQSLYKNALLDQTEFIELYQAKQTQYNPWTIHRKISAVGLAGSIGATLVGSLAMGDEYFATTVIPVVGPFITITRIENDPNAYYLSGGKQLLIASGIIQSAFLVYFVTSLIGESNYEGKYLSSNISVLPTHTLKGFGISMNIAF